MDRAQLIEELLVEAVKFYPDAVESLRADKAEEPLEAVFVPGRAKGDDDNILEIAADSQRAGGAQCIALNTSDGRRVGGTIPGEAWAGYSAWVCRLIEELRIPPEVILGTREALHNKAENEALLELAKKHHWRAIGFVTQPHQLLRWMLGMVATMRDHNEWLRVYAVSPPNTDWQKLTYGPQGAAELPRWIDIGREAVRIVPYQLKDDLCRFPELFEYRKRRSTIV